MDRGSTKAIFQILMDMTSRIFDLSFAWRIIIDPVVKLVVCVRHSFPSCFSALSSENCGDRTQRRGACARFDGGSWGLVQYIQGLHHCPR